MQSLVTYPCPSCGEMLEAENNAWQDWSLCPSCNKPGKPPYIRPQSQVYMEDILYIGTFPEQSPDFAGPFSPAATSPATRPQPRADDPLGMTRPVTPPVYREPGVPSGYAEPSNNMTRMVLGGGFFFSVVLTLVSLVQHNASQAGILAMVSVFLLVLLARSSSRG